MHAPLVPIALAFLLGILAAAHGLPLSLILLCGAVSAALGLGVWRRRGWGAGSALTLWVCLGMLRMALWAAHPAGWLESWLTDAPQRVRLHGIVLNDPVQPFEPTDLETGSGAEPTGRGPQVCVLQLRDVETGAGWQPLWGRVRAAFWGQTPQGRQVDQTGSDPTLRYGDEILAEGTWSRIPSPGNPGQYDWAAALSRQRIHGLFRAAAADGVAILRQGRGHPMLASIFGLRRRWEALIRQHFTAVDTGLLLSLLLGQRVALDERLKDAFVETGTIHLLVISGFNVGLIAGLLELLGRLLGLPWRVRLLFLVVGLGGYCILTGLQPPVVRATLMAWVALGAYALDRVISWPNTLAAAALVILWCNPTQLFDPGFQLSFGAVLCLLLFAGRWTAWLEPRMSWMRPVWLRRYVAVSLSATSAIWVGLAPLLAWYFHLVSPVSMVANLLLAPLLSVLITFGTGLLMVAAVWGDAIRWASGLLSGLLSATLACVEWCHRIPGGYWFTGRPAASLLLGYYVLLGVSLLKGRFGWTRNRLLVCWSAAVTIGLWSLVVHRAVESRWLRVDILDVGHGDSIAVRTPRGQTLLVDTGTADAGRHRVLPWLRFAGISTLDALVLTHPDADHIGGAVPLLHALAVTRLLTNGVRDDTMGALALRRLASVRRIPEEALSAGMRLGSDTGVEIEVLHPPRGLVPGVAPSSNDNSLVLRLTKGSVSILLCGDLEEEGLPWLLRTSQALRSTVLKVPHHGSRLGEGGKRLFSAAQPHVAIISVGRLHHLPAPETLQALARSGARVLSTRTDGAIHLRTDGRRLEVRTERSRRRMTIAETGGE